MAYRCRRSSTFSHPARRIGKHYAQVPADLRDSIFNDTGIAKIQYTHSLGSNAYARLFGYTFFSDWTQAGANATFNEYLWGVGGPFTPNIAANYDLITHTAGGESHWLTKSAPNTSCSTR